MRSIYLRIVLLLLLYTSSRSVVEIKPQFISIVIFLPVSTPTFELLTVPHFIPIRSHNFYKRGTKFLLRIIIIL